MTTDNFSSIIEEEIFFGVRRRERLAWLIAGGGILVGLLGVTAALLTLPLKETQAFLTIVDKDTGQAERVVQVERAGVMQADAIRQSLLFGYVMDRETFDEADNEARILDVFTRSEGSAKSTLVDLWNEANPLYPPKVYGQSAKVTVKVLSITPTSDTVSQVRFTKTLTTDEGEREGKFYATITYSFAPTTQSAIELVWSNPTGFLVTDYRVTAESQEAQQ